MIRTLKEYMETIKSSTLKGIFGDNQELEQRYVDVFIKALERKKSKHFDYINMKEAMNALSKLDSDEGIIIRSSFEIFSTVGLTKAKLIETAKFYKKVLLEEKKDFDIAAQKRIKMKISPLKSEVESLRQQVIKYDEKIEQLQHYVDKYRAEL